MTNQRLGTWLGWLNVAANVVYTVALCLAVALLVIAFIPGSPATLELPTAALTGLDGVGGLAAGVVVDPGGHIVFAASDPSLAQRLLHLATMLPGLLLVAEIARRMAKLLRDATDNDPFTVRTAGALTVCAKITAFGGLGVWAVSVVAEWVMSATMLASGVAVESQRTPLGWLAVGLIFAAFAQLVARGVAMRDELDTVI